MARSELLDIEPAAMTPAYTFLGAAAFAGLHTPRTLEDARSGYLACRETVLVMEEGRVRSVPSTADIKALMEAVIAFGFAPILEDVPLVISRIQDYAMRKPHDAPWDVPRQVRGWVVITSLWLAFTEASEAMKPVSDALKHLAAVLRVS